MPINTTKPIKVITKSEFKNMLINRIIEPSFHTLDHLSLNQRKVFKRQDLIKMIEKETPRKIYLQQNRRYAVYYRKKDGYRKIIISFEDKKAVIVSFMDTKEIPKIKLKK